MLQYSQDGTMIRRHVLIIFRIMEVLHVIPPLRKSSRYSGRFFGIFLYIMERFIS